MAAARIELTIAAFEDAEAAHDWYAERSKRAASTFLADLERSLERIAERPRAFARGRRETRRCLLQAFPFVVVYREEPDRIRVIAVAHTRRSPRFWLQRR